jgi:general secretion pathway protein B
MSYILDALQKAERDRDLARVPDLRTVPLSGPGRTRRLGLWALAFAMLVGAGVSIWLLTSSPTVHRPVPEEARPPRGNRDPEGGGDLHRALARLEAALAPPSSPEGTAPAKPETRHTEKAPGRSDREGSGATSVAALPPAPASPDLRPLRLGSPGDAPTEPQSIQAEPAEAQGDMASSRAPELITKAAESQQSPTPPVGQDSTPREQTIARPSPPPPENGPTLQEAVAKMKMGVFVYTEVKAKRVVVIDGRSYVEGDLVDGRYLVEAITSEGVVLSREGERALLKP